MNKEIIRRLLAEASGGNWMQKAVKRPGAFRAKAQRAGMGTMEFAQHVMKHKEKYDPRTVKQANLALIFNKYRPNK